MLINYKNKNKNLAKIELTKQNRSELNPTGWFAKATVCLAPVLLCFPFLRISICLTLFSGQSSNQNLITSKRKNSADQNLIESVSMGLAVKRKTNRKENSLLGVNICLIAESIPSFSKAIGMISAMELIFDQGNQVCHE